MSVTFQPLSLHVDSLELSYRGTLREGVSSRLDALKGMAQSADIADQSRAQFVAGDDTLLVRDKGAPRFPYVLENGAFHLKLAERSEHSPMPCVYCQFRNEYLVRTGPKKAEEELRELLRDVVQWSGSESVSRIDLALDFATDADMEGWTRRAWVTRLRKKNSFSDGEQFTGWKLGTHSNPVSMRLYNKSYEITRVSGKSYLHDIWENAGHIPWEAVWRVEGEFRREALREFSISTLSEAMDALGSLWHYLTSELVHLCIANEADQTRGRWLIHPLWEALAKVDWVTQGSQLQRRLRPNGAPSSAYLVRQMKALVTSKMARDGDTSAREATGSLLTLLEDHLEREGTLFTGESPERALEAIVAAKARKYFTRRNVIPGTPAPLTDAEAVRAYRDASGGR